jgi:hypothetical protein
MNVTSRVKLGFVQAALKPVEPSKNQISPKVFSASTLLSKT